MKLLNQVTEDVKIIRANLIQNGFAILQNRATPEACQHIMDFIDQYPDKEAEVNYRGTEKRIWAANSMDPILKNFGSFSDQVMGEVFNTQPKIKTVLAYSNYPIPKEERLITGRWHLDSLRQQFKLFCFLTPTEEHTGPFEIVPGSHRSIFKLFALVTGQYISPFGLGAGKRRYQSLDDHWVEAQCNKVGGSKPIICEAGTLVLVDTSAIHRARPCLIGNRYALCAYYDHF